MRVAEDEATRARRYRRHKQGDHSLCVAGRCEALGGAARTVPARMVPHVADVVTTVRDIGPDGWAWLNQRNPSLPMGGPLDPEVLAAALPVEDPAPGRIEQLTREYVKTLPYGVEDPRHLLGQLAIELSRRIDEAGAVPAAIGQLRQLLMQLAEQPNGPAGVVDELRVRHHQRQLDALLATAAA